MAQVGEVFHQYEPDFSPGAITNRHTEANPCMASEMRGRVQRRVNEVQRAEDVR